MRAALVLLLINGAAFAQIIINSARIPPHLRDMASPWDERPLECSVTPIRPTLNFAFRIQAGYNVHVPMNQFEGPGHFWVVLVRVTPREGDRKAVYLGARTMLPDVPKNKVEIEIGGGYLLGEGTYDVRWMMVDDQDRACHKDWTIEAKLSVSERDAHVAMPPNTVDAFSLRGTAGHPPAHDDVSPLKITILMHAAPLSPRRTRLRAMDEMLLMGSLSALLERLPTRAVRMVAFNLDQQKELYRNEGFTGDSIQQVWHALNKLELDLVDYHTLLNRKGHVNLIADLLNAEVHAESPSDAVIVLGPITRYFDKPPRGTMERPSGTLPQFFYFQYRSRMPQAAALPDTLTLSVNSLKGKVITIRTPADFAKAIAQLEKRAK